MDGPADGWAEGMDGWMDGWMDDANRAIEVTTLGSDWIVSGVVS